MDPGGDSVHNCTMLRNPAHLSKRNRSIRVRCSPKDLGLLGKRGRVERPNSLRGPKLFVLECLRPERFSRISITFPMTIGIVPILDSVCRIRITLFSSMPLDLLTSVYLVLAKKSCPRSISSGSPRTLSSGDLLSIS